MNKNPHWRFLLGNIVVMTLQRRGGGLRILFYLLSDIIYGIIQKCMMEFITSCEVSRVFLRTVFKI
jgi:hypothetical protein